MPSVCPFCKSVDKMTREHIFARWARDLYPIEDPNKHEILKADGSVLRYDQLPLHQQVKDFCQECNGGWMGALETQVAPILGPMVKDSRPTHLTRSRQRLIATWAVKTAFVMQYLHSGQRIVPESEYHRLYASQQPPKGYVVWLAHRRDFKDHTGGELLSAARNEFINSVNAAPEDRPKVEEWWKTSVVFRITFVLGHVGFQVFGHTFPGSFRITMPPASLRVVNWIWPAHNNVTWPPSEGIESIGGIDGWHKAFGGAPQAPDTAT